MTKIGFISLGCAKNQVDLERVAGTLANNYEFVSSPRDCEFMVVNTCGFIQKAVQEAIDTILSVKSEMKKDAKLIVFGCMSERYKEDFAKELPEVDFFAGVGVEEMQKVVDYISANKKLDICSGGRYLLNAPYYSYLKISEGCNNRCTYCTIPSIRGNHKSIEESAIIKEVATLTSAGAKEIIIISQDITKYGSDLNGKTNLAALVDNIAECFKDTYFRLMYLNPDGVEEKLLEVVAEHENIVKYFDIPVQHGSDNILNKMNRHYNSKEAGEVFNMVRKHLPKAFIRTTFIVGFPGESEKDFKDMLHFIEHYKPDFAGFFPYSPEPGTKAEQMSGAIDSKTIKNRLKILQSLQKKNTLNKLNSLKNDDILCFIENQNEDFDFILEGRAIFQAPEVDGKLYVIDGCTADGYGPYKAKIKKISYPDIYVELLERI